MSMTEIISLIQRIDEMSRVKILIVGDVMLDEYEHCVVKRISPEAPVPIAHVLSRSSFLGGAGNVANNVAALGAHATLVSVIGKDAEGAELKKRLQESNIEFGGLTEEEGRETTLKRRIVSGTHQLIRIDRETVREINKDTVRKIMEMVTLHIATHDAVIVSDYCKGLLTNEIIQHIIEEARIRDKKVFVDSKNKHFHKFANVFLVKPNKEEAEFMAGLKFDANYDNIEEVGKALKEIFRSNIVITLGGDGIALFERDQFVHKKTHAREVFDVSGAGDTVMAALATAVAAGAQLEEAVDISNYAAGNVVSKLGTMICTKEELKEMIMS